MRAIIGRWMLTAIAGAIGYVVGWLVSAAGGVVPRLNDFPFLAERFPYPHHVPEHAGGLSLRFAMVHDVLLERIPRLGSDHYRERNRVTRERLASLAPGDPARDSLEDDLAVGLERLGQSREAVAVMRGKLARQLEKGLPGRALYTSYANLGTFLIHARYPQAARGDSAARAECREGVDLLQKAVAVNPDAHFGRERWQAVVAEFLLAALDDRKLLTTFDCLGNQLDLSIERALDRGNNWTETGYGRPNDAAFSQGKADAEVPLFFRQGVAVEDPTNWPELAPIRVHITKIGAESDWENVAVPSHRAPVPFDEPTLGIVGMWREGGGASPHFALALGETMLRVGQRYLAWEAYERASRLAERFSPDPAMQQFLRHHCQTRQAEIEKTLRIPGDPAARRVPWQQVSPSPARETVASLRSAFETELEFGERYQRGLQHFEADQRAAGAAVDSTRLFAAYRERHGPVASPVGPEDSFVRVGDANIRAFLARRHRAFGWLSAGICALAAALLLAYRPRVTRWRQRATSF